MPLAAMDEGSRNRRSTFRKVRRSATLDLPDRGTSQRTTSRNMSQSLTDLVTCPICLEQLRRPTMLPCQHTFCLLCLQNYVRDDRHLITCPTCRNDCQLPSEGVSGLPTNIALQSFLETLRQEQQQERQRRQAAAGTTAPIETDGISARESGRCSRCAINGTSQTPCPHCNQVFCSSCNVVHSNEQRNRWASLVDDLYAEEQRLSLLTEEYKVRVERLEDQIQMAAEIRVQRIMEDRDRLLSELKTRHGQEEVRMVEMRQKCIEAFVTGPKIAEDTALLTEEFFTRTRALLETARLIDAFRLTFDDEEFRLTKDDVESSRPRRVTIRSSADEESGIQPHSPSSQTPVAVLSTADDQSLHYRCKKNPRLRMAPSVLQRPAGVAVSPWTGDIYVAGTDSRCVYVMDRNGKIIKSLGSPYRSSSSTGSTSTGGTAHSNGHFLCPFGIAFSTATEEILVTDKWLNCIQVFGRDGNYLRQIGNKGTSPGHFRSPEGIAVDARGYVYVADTCNDRVQVLDRHGVFVREVGRVSQMTLPGGRPYQKREFNEPTGVAVSASGDRVAVCDFGNCRIKVFGPSGERLAVFGFRGTSRGQFQQPECLVMDEMGFILVGDNGNGRIQIFRPNGNFVTSLGAKGSGAGQFNWISGLALTSEREIIAADFKNHCIQIF